jgi:hypothetical protein
MIRAGKLSKKRIKKMKEFSNKFNRITGIKINKVLIILFFILAGSTVALISNKGVSTEKNEEGLTIEVCLNDYSIGQTIAKKEYKCSSGLDIRTKGDVSKSITQLYNQLKSSFNKMLNT